ncbi:hypothetical protein KEM09_04680 [Carboxylicivirga mesophila]|uniref:Alpha-L-rhamnosidase six-hairpin glycosidase domain-containing protein n=1 Tax=Carboxylicivirga mesophila TaxID=1166478 RepID=A0ABS5K818_9BACT|nr:hypothetical protein [Carboxylicivirga mesophila]MBS2210683.1 hypothetical protein [Carboxylicivirga mesophila]
MKNIFLIVLFLISFQINGQNNANIWEINKDCSISWSVNGAVLPHHDDIEMSGKFISAVVKYGVNADNSFSIGREIVWPMLRIIPNQTRGGLLRTINDDVVEGIHIEGRRPTQELVHEVQHDGTLSVRRELQFSYFRTRPVLKLQLESTHFTSYDQPVFCEKYVLRNPGDKAVFVEIPETNKQWLAHAERTVDGPHFVTYQTINGGSKKIAAGDSIVFYTTISAHRQNEKAADIDVEEELVKRASFVGQLCDNLVLETPDKTLNTAFAFAKIRANESIYQTKGGPMHGPGGLNYYAAIWANDQAEYINPFFPFQGYDYGNESAINAFRHFARFMNDAYEPIPSSIIAEGISYWNGAGDRGDAAMIAYGAARFALTYGDKKTAEELWPLIEWCLEFSRRKINEHGVVSSDSDELEGRFPAGDANLCTSSLYYDALQSASFLCRELQLGNELADNYATQALTLRKNIEQYFGANVMDFDTYRYYEGNDILRAWICIPLTVGIYERKAATIDALFSPDLWTADGLATEAGDTTFWDRSTLYGLRGVFAAGETKRGLEFLKYYSNRRLLGDRVPYPVEAYPENNQRHLSAESALYCRVYIEGLFGIRPTGFNSFSITPQLPDEWDYMNIRKMHGFGQQFDVELIRKKGKVQVMIKDTQGKALFRKSVTNGTTIQVKL